MSFFKGEEEVPAHSVHNILMKTLDGEPLPLARFKGRKLLVVNVASECGLTPQYAQLQQLQVQYSDTLSVLGVPCNDFAGQEPGTPPQIKEFCSSTYNVTFPLTEKVNIKTAPIHPLYQFLTSKEQNLLEDSEVEWNFQKYLLDEKGRLTHVFPPPTEPLSEEMRTALLG
jgi:glutathione peroxidase